MIKLSPCKLSLKNSDGSDHFVMFFNTKDECNSWLENEKKKEYWIQDIQVVVEDLTVVEDN
jgi:hypothetical protein